MGEWTIRSAREHEIPAVLALWRTARSPAGAEDRRESVLRLLATDREALLVAVRGGSTGERAASSSGVGADTAAGAAAGAHEVELLGSLIAAWDGWRGSFYRLAVHPDWRRRGLARALLAEGEWRLCKRGAQRLTAIVAGDERAAMGFWTAAGYEHQRERERFVRQIGDPAA